MKKTRRSAFTIVELVIVIAVIAILSAVLIPTFGSIINNANVAADKATASTLTSELHVYLKGETIDNEGELVAALEDSGIGAKLTPKALQQSYHFWFNMATQSFEVKTSAEVQDINPATASVENRAALMSETDTPVEVTTSFRDIYGKGYYLIDAAGSSYSAYAIELIDTLNRATDYEYLIEDVLANAMTKDADTVLGQAIYDKVIETTIHTRSGAYFYNGASKYEYFTSKSNSIGTKYFNFSGGDVAEATNLPVPSVAEGMTPVVSVPTHLVYIPTGALNYATNEAVTLYMPTTEFAASVFSPNSTNALIQLGDQDKIHVITTVTPESATLDVLKTKESVGVDQTYTALLSSLLPFDAFNIGTPETDNVSVMTEGDKIYVLSKNGTLQLYAVNAENKNETSGRVGLWEVVTSDSNGSFTIDPKTGVIDLTTCAYKTVGEYNVCEVVVKATADKLSGGTATDTVTIVVAMPVSATLTVTTHPKNGSSANLSSVNSTNMNLYFTGDLFTYDVYNVEASYTTDSEGNDAYYIATGGTASTDSTPVISVSKKNIDGSDTVFAYDAVNDRLILNTPDVYHGAQYNLTLLVDNCLKVNSVVTASDASAVILNTTYRYDSTTVRPYYIGSGNAIALDEIFKAIDANFTEDVTATINIYDAVGNSGKLYPLYLANRTADRLSVTVNDEALDSFVIDSAGIATSTLAFEFKSNTKTQDIYIEVIPSKETLNTLVLKFTVINGAMNVFEDNIDAVDGYFAAGKDVVLYTDITAETGDTISIGEGQTLYGNGNVIIAKSFTSGKTETYYKWEKIGTEQYCNVCNAVNPASNSNCYKYPEDDANGHSTYTSGWFGSKNRTNIKTRDVNGDKEYTIYISQNVSLIQLNGGTVDNIYVDGPVYPNLQYQVSDGTLSDVYKEKTEEGRNNKITLSTVNTPYYASGIKVIGNATISNSYVNGFRQPVQVDNEGTEKVNIINTTLHGGNYANLDIVDGDVHLKDVTTIQDQAGSKPTVGTDEEKSKNVIGLGIVRGLDSLNNALVITGYLDQYNWISSDVVNNTNIKLPSLAVNNATLDTKTLFDGVFNGYKATVFYVLNVVAEAGSVKFVIVQDDTQDSLSPSTGYINAGIIFAHVGTGANGLTEAQITNPDTTGRVAGKLPLRAMNDKPILDTIFSKLGLEGVATAATELGTDGRLILWGTPDYRAWVAADIDMSDIRGSIEKLEKVTINGKTYFKRWVRITDDGTGKAAISAGKTTYQIDKDTELNYSGYYTEYYVPAN